MSGSRRGRRDATERVHRTTDPGADAAGGGGGGLAAVGLAAGAWLLLLVTVPVAIFLTWWGDCFEDACASASDLDRAIYLFDLAAWFLLPALAFGAYRGWRAAGVGLIAIGIGVMAQVGAAAVGARGFQAFPIVLPAGGLLLAAGFVGLRPTILLAAAGAGGAGANRTGMMGLAVLSVVVVAIALQGMLVGGGGVGQVILAIVAVSLVFITLVAVSGRGRQPPRSGGGRRRR